MRLLTRRDSQRGRKILSPLTVDCANGVGAPKLKAFTEVISSSILPLNIVGDAITTPGALNSKCGADYVKTQQRAPPFLADKLVPGQRYCSFDGDADRIVFYYTSEDGVFHLLDGDKIAGLAAGFIIDLVKEAGLKLQVGVVQTAYANGASTDYLKNVLVSAQSFLKPRPAALMLARGIAERAHNLRPDRRQAPAPCSRVLRHWRVL